MRERDEPLVNSHNKNAQAQGHRERRRRKEAVCARHRMRRGGGVKRQAKLLL